MHRQNDPHDSRLISKASSLQGAVILSAIEQGDPSAAEQLLPLVYDELRQLAARRLAAERADHTLQPTALVHEAYVRRLLEPYHRTAHGDWASSPLKKIGPSQLTRRRGLQPDRG